MSQLTGNEGYNCARPAIGIETKEQQAKEAAERAALEMNCGQNRKQTKSCSSGRFTGDHRRQMIKATVSLTFSMPQYNWKQT